MLIMGIDPGSLRCGFGIIEKKADGTVNHISHGTIVLNAQQSLAERLKILACDLLELIHTYKPQNAVIEDIFVYKNPRSALILGQARGAVITVLGLEKIPMQSLSPTAVKALIIGKGRASKLQIAHMVALELKIPLPKSLDASDALSLALAGRYMIKLR
jgi:crossover junction endodeoxyribonuclease RuvC